ncbi:MAG: aminoacetone oxidase family FAD-binding enzyme [Clostridia bacterium]|nr:aminoacetone oxidase family FAD-binding enzyme [Clostridia bacterium]
MKTAIIGGGASGLILATALQNVNEVTVFERNERVGKKLSATGNGQGNVTNLAATKEEYFSFGNVSLAKTLISRYDDTSFAAYLESLGLLLLPDERGRVYPAGRQASAVTDALRFAYAGKTELATKITDIEKTGKVFSLTAEDGRLFVFDRVVLCCGGKAAKNFGTDGNGYALAGKLGHTQTPLYPSLVQLKTDTTHIKTLKGIRVINASLTARWQGGVHTLQGDVIFTEYGVSGDAVFRMSAFIAGKQNVTLEIDFLPPFSQEKMEETLKSKLGKFPETELLCGIVNNQVGRAIMKRAGGDIARASALVKAFPLPVTGSLGFDYAQVTKGGIPLDEVDENLQSKKVKGLYFAGEILDVDGQCGGFNLQWAYASARTVATALEEEARGQV